MSSSPSPLKPKFLLDENVQRRLGLFVKSEGFEVVIPPKGVSNGKLMSFSKTQNCILVTNDSDFSSAPQEKIF